MGEGISTIQRSPQISTSYNLPLLAIDCRRWPCRRFRWASLEPRLSTALKDRSVVPYCQRLSLCPSPLPRYQQRCLCTSRRDACERISDRYPSCSQRQNPCHSKGNKHRLGLFFLLEACQRNAAGWSTAGWPANAKLPHRHSSIARPCCSSAQAPSFLSLHALEHLTQTERVDAEGRRAVEVIICMITRTYNVFGCVSENDTNT